MYWLCRSRHRSPYWPRSSDRERLRTERSTHRRRSTGSRRGSNRRYSNRLGAFSSNRKSKQTLPSRTELRVTGTALVAQVGTWVLDTDARSLHPNRNGFRVPIRFPVMVCVPLSTTRLYLYDRWSHTVIRHHSSPSISRYIWDCSNSDLRGNWTKELTDWIKRFVEMSSNGGEEERLTNLSALLKGLCRRSRLDDGNKSYLRLNQNRFSFSLLHPSWR